MGPATVTSATSAPSFRNPATRSSARRETSEPSTAIRIRGATLPLAAVLEEVGLAGEMQRAVEKRQPLAEHGRTDRVVDELMDRRTRGAPLEEEHHLVVREEDPLPLRDPPPLAARRRPLEQLEGLLARPGPQCGDEHDAFHLRRVYDRWRRGTPPVLEPLE